MNRFSTFLTLGLLLAAAGGATAQTTPATDAWGTPAPAVAPTAAPATAPDAAPVTGAVPAPDAATAAPGASTGIEAALGAESAATKPSKTVKPISSQPKLNPNSAGTYDKKIVKTQNKHSNKVISKRRRATTRYASARRHDQNKGIRNMEKGKVSAFSQR